MTSPASTAPTGRHAAPVTSPDANSGAGEHRASFYPLLITQPLSTFFGDADNMERCAKAQKKLATVVREYCGVDAAVALTRPLRQMTDDDETDTFNAAELGVKFTNVTRKELLSYCEILTNVLTGENRIKLLDGPDYADVTAEPIVEFPDRERIEESQRAVTLVAKLAADRKANGGTLAASTAKAADGGDAGSLAAKFAGLSEEDLI